MAQNRTPIEQVWSAKGNLPNNAIVATADGKYPALDGSLITGVAGAGDMNASVYDPTTIQADAFARVNHTGTQAATTITDFDTEVGLASAVVSNSAKVTNATHTGDVTGSTALTIAVDAVDIPMLSATGTADGTTFLRGDNVWAIPAGGGDMEAATYDPNAWAVDVYSRANHTGTQLASTISDFDTEVSNNAKLAGYSPIAIITESTTARSLALTDIGAYIRLTNAASCTITLPANATVAWAGETEPPTIYFRVAAAGIPTLSNAGVTVNDTLGVVAALEAGSTFALQWVATDVWDII
jgi:hypothetical protein